MSIDKKYDDIRPFHDSEVSEALEELLNIQEIQQLIPQVLPGKTHEDVRKENIQSIEDFKLKVSLPILFNVLEKTSFSLTASGMSQLDPNKAYTFVTNHRDIVLDSAFLSVLLNQHGKKFPQVAIGDNLLISPWIEKLVRINNAFIVKRKVSLREMLQESEKLSSYIRRTLTEANESVWIAQREGRAKDSDDRTQTAMLKMLAMSYKGSLSEALEALNIVPVSISYEYDPCDYLKAQEMFAKKLNPKHQKTAMDDFENMRTGITGQKGRIHFAVCEPLSDLSDLDRAENKQVALQILASKIDQSIHQKYRLYPGNYVAHDLLRKTDTFASMYSAKEKQTFESYLNQKLTLCSCQNEEQSEYIRKCILTMYSNPLINKEKALKKK